MKKNEETNKILKNYSYSFILISFLFLAKILKNKDLATNYANE